MKNTLTDLNNHLFAQIERLNQEGLTKDNNPLNCCIENLEAVTRHENLLLNKADYANEIEELKPTVKAIARLESKVHALRAAMQ